MGSLGSLYPVAGCDETNSICAVDHLFWAHRHGSANVGQPKRLHSWPEAERTSL